MDHTLKLKSGGRPLSALFTHGARLILAGALLSSSACSDDPVDLGDGLIAVDRSALSSYAAIWTGYVEAKAFPSGSDRVQIRLDELGNGVVILGEGVPPALPTNPENPFGLGAANEPLNELQRGFEGFEYAIQDALVENERIRAHAFTSAHLDAACALQTPVPVTGSDAYGCFELPLNHTGHAYDEFGNDICYVTDPAQSLDDLNPPPRHELPCWQLSLCSHCVCEESGCRASRRAEFRFDGALDDTGTRLEGTIINRAIEPTFEATARLTRED